MSLKLKFAPLLAATTLALASLPAHATNGTFLPGYGIQSEGMGGVAIASGQDSISAAANPANLAHVGMRGDIDLTVFNPNVKAGVDCGANGVYNFGCYSDGQGNPTGPMGTVNSTSDLYFIPNMGIAMPLTDRLSVGFAAVAASGMGSTYNPNFFSYAGPPVNPPNNASLGIQLMQMLVPLSVAFKVTDTQTIGFSFVPALQRFSASGLDAFATFNISTDPKHMTGQGAQLSYGWGVRVGWIGNFLHNKVSLGATYATKSYMSKLGGYRGLFPDRGSLDIPANFGFGLALRPTHRWLLAMDIERIMYADVPGYGDPGPTYVKLEPKIPPPSSCATSATPSYYCLGMPQGMGFGWQNMTVYKFGVAYKATPKLTLRAGYNYAHSPIPDSQLTFNLLAPATAERHYSVGMTYSYSDNLDISAMYMRVPPNSQSAGQTGTKLAVIGAGEFAMNQNYFGVGLSWVLDRGND